MHARMHTQVADEAPAVASPPATTAGGGRGGKKGARRGRGGARNARRARGKKAAEAEVKAEESEGEKEEKEEKGEKEEKEEKEEEEQPGAAPRGPLKAAFKQMKAKQLQGRGDQSVWKEQHAVLWKISVKIFCNQHVQQLQCAQKCDGDKVPYLLKLPLSLPQQ
eukprot:1156491-Pelagomonas_calceolata.AAC.4